MPIQNFWKIISLPKQQSTPTNLLFQGNKVILACFFFQKRESDPSNTCYICYFLAAHTCHHIEYRVLCAFLTVSALLPPSFIHLSLDLCKLVDTINLFFLLAGHYRNCVPANQSLLHFFAPSSVAVVWWIKPKNRETHTYCLSFYIALILVRDRMK